MPYVLAHRSKKPRRPPANPSALTKAFLARLSSATGLPPGQAARYWARAVESVRQELRATGYSFVPGLGALWLQGPFRSQDGSQRWRARFKSAERLSAKVSPGPGEWEEDPENPPGRFDGLPWASRGHDTGRPEWDRRDPRWVGLVEEV